MTLRRSIFAAAIAAMISTTAFAAPGAAASLAGTSWMMELPKGSSCEVPPEIQFRKDGSIAGNAGCNDFKGSWKADGDSLSVN